MATPATTTSLAQHLHQATMRDPESLALLANDGAWTYVQLLADINALAEEIGCSAQPLCKSGGSLDLARYTYACSAKNRPFWPVDRGARQHFPSASDKLPDASLIISTSGSEGQPRAVLLGNAQLDAAAAASNQSLPLGPGDLWLNCLPLHHIGGQAILWRCARAAATLLLHDGFNAETVARDLEKHPVTHISLVPAMLVRLLELGTKPPASLRVTLIGGAALCQAVHDRALAANWPLYPSYGMTETAAQLATWLPTDGPWHEGQVGKPMPGHEIRIDQNGRISIRGPQVMHGYLNGGGVDNDGWLLTGDLGQLDASGRLTVTGRADDMLISGGYNIHPLVVESCLTACSGVRDVAVTGLADPVWGHLIVALVVGDTEPSALLKHARQHLPSAALPRKIMFLEHLPRNAAGKLERTALRRIAAEGSA